MLGVVSSNLITRSIFSFVKNDGVPLRGIALFCLIETGQAAPVGVQISNPPGLLGSKSSR